MIQQNPNITVLQASKRYLEAAEILFINDKFDVGAVLSALSIELSLKSFLAERIAPWTATTVKGHSFVNLYRKLNIQDQKDLGIFVSEINDKFDLEEKLREFDGQFKNVRYMYEPNSPKVLSNEIFFLAQALVIGVSKLAEKRRI